MSNTVFQSEKITIKDDTELQAAVITIKGRVESDEYRAGMEANYELSQKPHIKHWLQDNTNAEILSLDDQKWVAETLIPKASRNIDKIAIVISTDVFRKFASKRVIDKQEKKLNVEYFTSMDKATSWLKS